LSFVTAGDHNGDPRRGFRVYPGSLGQIVEVDQVPGETGVNQQPGQAESQDGRVGEREESAQEEFTEVKDGATCLSVRPLFWLLPERAAPALCEAAMQIG